jgi:hydroxymethylbilane synthase
MTQTFTELTIGSRGSMLALWQADYVQSMLKNQGVTSNINVIKTTGDRIQDRFLHEIGGKGLFVKEIEQALLDQTADLAIHSLKDLPAKTPAAFTLAAILKRHLPTDVLIFKKEFAQKTDLPEGMITREKMASFGKVSIATGSLRRSSLLKEASSQINVVPIRGNVDTRLRKLEESEWHGLILAEASLERLNLKSGLVFRTLDPDWFVPSPAQGALAIETLKSKPELSDWINNLGCQETRFHVELERLILERLGGDCTMPFGCYFRHKENKLIGDAIILNENGDNCRSRISLDQSENYDTHSIVKQMLDELKDNGANKILTDLKLKTI